MTTNVHDEAREEAGVRSAAPTGLRLVRHNGWIVIEPDASSHVTAPSNPFERAATPGLWKGVPGRDGWRLSFEVPADVLDRSDCDAADSSEPEASAEQLSIWAADCLAGRVAPDWASPPLAQVELFVPDGG